MGKASRTKGKTGEREVQALLKASGLDHSRHQDGQGQPADFRVEDFQLEVRRREALSLKAWSNEIEAKVHHPLKPAVAYRTNGEPWRVSLRLADFLSLLSNTQPETDKPRSPRVEEEA